MSTPQSDRNPEPTSRRAAHGAHTRRHGRGAGTDGGQVLLVVLVVLALAASVVMQFTDSHAALKLALLAALWACVIGFFLVSRYRRQVQRAGEQLAYEQRLHRSELREAQARAQVAESRRGDADSRGLSEEEIALLGEIRAGIDEVRSKLEDLQGHAFEYEPAALRAQAWRLQELENAVPPVVTEKTGHIAGAPSVDAVAGRLGHTDGAAEAARSISPELAHVLDSEAHAYRGSRRAAAAEVPRPNESAGHHEAASPLEPSVEDTAEIAVVPPETEASAVGGRGRRRADEHSGGLSVAELMANMRRGEQ
ncbi:hypothetical protein H7347_03815 [Corynebacterium sp. zg-331]|uniref:DUF6779 domain-containing protein n=1 Tax=unclassified Corynebacterium TaxID=2624378 RepID=UPI00128C9356|nr:MULTISPECIES: DUF6779 domain-containing protein [unclassified Corynebacterium]MBC3185707.1 hypothetical protein [Corynebacterium sp. zg-331]MPV52200.1 hypothetical protein [Corynebacterium sp. zg331]